MKDKLSYILIIVSLFICASSVSMYAMNKLKYSKENEILLNLNTSIENIKGNDKGIEYIENVIKSSITRDGDTNIGNGGDGGDYDNTNGKDDTILGNVQDEGVRVTLLDLNNNQITTPIDFANNPRQPIQIHFNKFNKLYYSKKNNNIKISNQKYIYKTPKNPLPKIVGGDLQTIKKYFGSEMFLLDFSDLTGVPYETLINGKYKIMLEPIGYPKIKGKVTACTATELALFDKVLNGSIRNGNIQNFSHKNLPLAMFLEKKEFDIPKYTGSTSTKRDNRTIISYLGVGAVTFDGDFETPPPEVGTIDYVYRTNTEVITSIKVSGGEANPSKPEAYAMFNINGETYLSNTLIYPEGEFAYAYIKWKTPKEPQIIQVPVKIYTPIQEAIEQPDGSFKLKQVVLEKFITIEIKDLEENTPPNPVADDRNDNFVYEDKVPKIDESPIHEWKEYEAVWVPVWKEIMGQWEDKGYYEYSVINYKAELKTNMDIFPAGTVRTNIGDIEMKSGYGLEQATEVKLSVTAEIDKVELEFKERPGYPKPETIVHRNTYPYEVNGWDVATKSQNAISLFSDFNYKTYWRVLEDTNPYNSKKNVIFSFKNNRYSTYNHRTHFTPIWYPDYTDYKIATYVFDAWTPVGMLSKNMQDSIHILGNLWDDYYVQPLPPDYE